MLSKLGCHDEALVAIETAIRLNPEHADDSQQ